MLLGELKIGDRFTFCYPQHPYTEHDVLEVVSRVFNGNVIVGDQHWSETEHPHNTEVDLIYEG